MNLEANCIAFAEVPQAKYKNEQYLRKFRKCLTNKHNSCRSSANNVRNGMLFAEIPQTSNKNVTYLRNFRKQDAEKKRIFAEGKRSQTETKSIHQHINALNAI